MMDDLISRQAAIEAINTWDKFGVDERGRLVRWHEGLEPYVHLRDVVTAIVDLPPSAQPEVIRCTECKHYREYDSEYVENAVVVQCMADRYPISEAIPDGWFCAGAERKDDE